IEIQLRWKNVFEAYTEWRKALDSIGIMSFQTSDSKIKLDEMRGFSNSQMPLPITVINKNDFPAARIFSLMHELAHILLRKEGICEFENVDVLAEEEREIEKFCNHVAGAVLVPEYHLLSQPIIGKLSKKNMVDDLEILNLSRLYKASREVVLRRLLHFGLISSDYYSDKKEIYDKEAKKKATEEAHRAAKGGNRFIVPIYLKNMYSNGRGYTDLILKSYYQEKITLSDVSGYLGIKLKHLPKIEAAMSRFISYA
ncbi:MAG: ImmA/IrrE family metallo-endopeptidase, partial [Candidatus Atribacteria bacterium]|nr:ImmA/IrrE family metallo-endopeptidase [Candidatus Atribacteria bacterium]